MNLPRRLLRDRDHDCRVGLSDEVACFALPLELMSVKQRQRWHGGTDGIDTHSPHLKVHLKVKRPVCFSSTTLLGLYSSRVLALFNAAGAVALASSDWVRGSAEAVSASSRAESRTQTHQLLPLYTQGLPPGVSDNAQFLRDRRDRQKLDRRRAVGTAA